MGDKVSDAAKTVVKPVKESRTGRRRAPLEDVGDRVGGATRAVLSQSKKVMGKAEATASRGRTRWREAETVARHSEDSCFCVRADDLARKSKLARRSPKRPAAAGDHYPRPSPPH